MKNKGENRLIVNRLASTFQKCKMSIVICSARNATSCCIQNASLVAKALPVPSVRESKLGRNYLETS